MLRLLMTAGLAGLVLFAPDDGTGGGANGDPAGTPPAGDPAGGGTPPATPPAPPADPLAGLTPEQLAAVSAAAQNRRASRKHGRRRPVFCPNEGCFLADPTTAIGTAVVVLEVGAPDRASLSISGS